MVIDMHVHPVLYGEICTPGDRPDGFGYWQREFGMGHMVPMSWKEIEVQLDLSEISLCTLLPLDIATTKGGALVSNEQVAQLVAAHPDRLQGFASVDPHRGDAPDVLEHAFRDLKAQGLCLHPAKQKFEADDSILEPLYDLCKNYNRPVLFESGLSWEPDAPMAQSNPLAFEHTIMRHPKIRICLTHFGWPWVREMVALMLKYPNCYTDTAITYIDSPEEMMRRLFTVDMGPLWYERSLSHQVMFGSNAPRFRAFKLKRALDALPMRADARQRLYAGTATRFLKGDES